MNTQAEKAATPAAYKPPMNSKYGAEGDPDYAKLTDEEREKRVLSAIDAKYRTYSSIKKAIGCPAAGNISELLDGMITSFKIRRADAGEIYAWFRFEDMPKRVWMIGEGRVEAEFDPEFKPRDEAAKQGEYQRQYHRSASDDDDILEIDEAPPRQLVSPPLNGSNNKPVAKKAAEPALKASAAPPTTTLSLGEQRKASHFRLATITAKEVQDIAAEHGALKAVAKAVGVGQPAFSRLLNQRKDIRLAYKEGRKLHALNEEAKAPVAVLDPADDGKTAENYYQAAKGGMTIKAYGKSLGVKDCTIHARMKAQPELREAWERGHREVEVLNQPLTAERNTELSEFADDISVKFVPGDDWSDVIPDEAAGEGTAGIPERFIDLVDLPANFEAPTRIGMEEPVMTEPHSSVVAIAVANVSRLGMEIEEVEAKTATGSMTVPPSSTTTIAMASGHVAVAIDVNLFDESPEARAKLMQLVDLVQEMRQG